MALNMNQFELCELFQPNTSEMTLCENSILVSIINKGINPVLVEGQKEAHKRLQALQ